jgi:hypothetical protein
MTTADVDGSQNRYRPPPFGVLHWRAELERLDYVECAQGLIRARKFMIQSSQQQQQQHSSSSTTNIVPATNSEDMPFILMSSLSLDESIEWNGARRHSTNTTARQALQMLLGRQDSDVVDDDYYYYNKNNKKPKPFLKLENAFLPSSKFPDKVYYPIIDLIVAQRASMFGTCTKTCHRKHNGRGYPMGSNRLPTGRGYCTSCNYVGKFAELSLRLREQHQHEQHHEQQHDGMTVQDNNNSNNKYRQDWSCWPGS